MNHREKKIMWKTVNEPPSSLSSSSVVFFSIFLFALCVVRLYMLLVEKCFASVTRLVEEMYRQSLPIVQAIYTTKFSTTKNNPPSVSAKNTICYNVGAAKCLWKKCARLGSDEMLAWKNSYIRRIHTHTQTHSLWPTSDSIDEASTHNRSRAVALAVYVFFFMNVCWVRSTGPAPY